MFFLFDQLFSFDFVFISLLALDAGRVYRSDFILLTSPDLLVVTPG